MTGDDRSRVCGECNLSVHNFAAMSEKEIEKLLRSQNGEVCARIFRRHDGTILTNDCPRGMRWAKLKIRRWLTCFAIVVVWLTLAFKQRAEGALAGGHSYEKISAEISTSNLGKLRRFGKQIWQIERSESAEEQIKNCKAISHAADVALARKQLMDELKANFSPGPGKEEYRPNEDASLGRQFVDGHLSNAVPVQYDDTPFEPEFQYGGLVPFDFETPESKLKLLATLVSWLLRITVAMVGIPAAIAMFLLAKIRD